MCREWYTVKFDMPDKIIKTETIGYPLPWQSIFYTICYFYVYRTPKDLQRKTVESVSPVKLNQILWRVLAKLKASVYKFIPPTDDEVNVNATDWVYRYDIRCSDDISLTVCIPATRIVYTYLLIMVIYYPLGRLLNTNPTRKLQDNILRDYQPTQVDFHSSFFLNANSRQYHLIVEYRL